MPPRPRTPEEEDAEAARLNADMGEDDDFVRDPDGSRPYGGDDYGSDDDDVDTRSEAEDERDEEEDDDPDAGRATYDDDDDFEEIARAQMERQAGNVRDFDGDMSRRENLLGKFGDTDEGEGDGEAGGEGETPPAPSGEQQPQEVDIDENALVTMTVRGEKVRLPYKELVARAQMTEAGDSYMAEARRVLDHVNELKRTYERGDTPTAQQAAPLKDVSPELAEEGRRLHELITYGTPEEIERGLSQFQEDTIRRTTETIARQQAETARNQALESEIRSASDDVVQTHPEFAESEVLRARYLDKVVHAQRWFMREFVENLPEAQKAAFARGNITPASIARFTPERAMKVYTDMVKAGWQLPAVGTVLREVAGYTARELKLPSAKPADPEAGTTPASRTEGGRAPLSRQERKQRLTPTPHRASVEDRGRTAAPRPENERDVHRAALDEFREQSQGFVRPRGR